MDFATDSDGFVFDIPLINDLETSSEAATLQDITLADIHQDMIACNQLLGIIAAILVVFMIWGLMNFFYRLITDNITNYF